MVSMCSSHSPQSQAEVKLIESMPSTTSGCMLSQVPLCAAPRTVAPQAPLSMGFSRQEHWSGLPFPPPGDLPDPGIEPPSTASPESPALAGRCFITGHQGRLRLILSGWYVKWALVGLTDSLVTSVTLSPLRPIK